MSFSFGAETRDSLSNLAASLGAGKDKAAGDAFFGEPSRPPAPQPKEESPSQVPPNHSSLPDSERDGFELPDGITPEEAKELHLTGSPVGVSFEVRGNNTTALGTSYSDAVNTYAGAERAPSARELGSSEPDGILNAEDLRNAIAIEAKYIESWVDSLYNPDIKLPFPHETAPNTVGQALKYSKAYPTGVKWYTNSVDFVKAYAKKFKEAGIENFTFTVIPATRTKP